LGTTALEGFVKKVKNGDRVKIHYTGKLKGGELFDTSRERQPLEFTVGNREIMPGLKNSLIGMEAGHALFFDLELVEV
jgi:peptidylprolyl isomerase